MNQQQAKRQARAAQQGVEQEYNTTQRGGTPNTAFLEFADTTELRDHILKKLKGKIEVQERVTKREIRDDDGNVLDTFYAADAGEAKQRYQDMDIDHDTTKLVRIGDDTKEMTRTKYDSDKRLVPDHIADNIVATIDPLIGIPGKTTKLEMQEINTMMRTNLAKLRRYLLNCYYRYDIGVEDMDNVVQLVINLIFPQIMGSKEGWTGELFADTTQQRVVTKQETGGMTGWFT